MIQQKSIRLSRRQFGAGSLALASLGFAGTARAAGEVNLYSARHYPADELLFAAFTKETGIKVNMIQGKAEELMERVKLEGESSPCDVFITVDAGNLWRAQEAGVFQPVKSDFLIEKVPAQYHEPNGNWFGFSTRARVFIYHKDRVKPEDMSTYADLADPKWKGRILCRSSNNIYNQSWLAAQVEHIGEEKAEAWARGLVGNFARKPEGGDTDQFKAVIAGEGDLAIANTYYFARALDGDDEELKKSAQNLGVFFPDQDGRGTHVNVSGAGVAAYAPNRDNAVKFIEFMAKPEAQEIFSSANSEYPVVPGSKQTPSLDSWGPFKADELNVAALGRNNPTAVKIMDRVGWL